MTAAERAEGRLVLFTTKARGALYRVRLPGGRHPCCSARRAPASRTVCTPAAHCAAGGPNRTGGPAR